KDSDGATRVAATNGFCALAKNNAVAASPYLRIAARDDRDEVRTAAAGCLHEVAAGDPKGAARMASELGESGAALVRAAAAEALATAGLGGLLRQAARDGDEGGRLEAVRAASAAKGPGLDIVRGAVDDHGQTVRAEAMRLLAGGAGGGSRDVLPTFEAMLRGG